MWLINLIREKMIRKWIVLNIGITLLVIIIVGFSIKELACYQFNQYADSTLQSEQFRQVIESYLIKAGIVAFFLAIFVHLFFAKRILTPLKKLSTFSRGLDQKPDSTLFNVLSKDEVGQIASDLNIVSKQLNHLHAQRNKMSADLAHELRTPLTVLNGYLEALETGVFNEDKAIYTLLKNECAQLTNLAENMHELQRWEHEQIKIKNEPIAITDVIRSAVALFQNRFEELKIQVDVQADSAYIASDQHAIITTLSHLLDNVVQFDVGKKLQIKGMSLGNEYVISVSNQGLTIPNEVKKDLFEKFYRAEGSRNRETGGPGLGLALVKEIVKQLGGKVKFNTNNHFHTFSFSIPTNNKK